jgi:hypothetical protein
MMHSNANTKTIQDILPHSRNYKVNMKDMSICRYIGAETMLDLGR